MKKVLLLAFIASSCSDGRNELMTKLINQKKVAEDSLKSAKYYELDLLRQAKENMSDTNVWHPLSDSSDKYFMKGVEMKNLIKELEFSIDSLSKMK